MRVLLEIFEYCKVVQIFDDTEFVDTNSVLGLARVPRLERRSAEIQSSGPNHVIK